MKPGMLLCAALAWMMAVGAACSGAQAPTGGSLADYMGFIKERKARIHTNMPKMVLAFYYPWYRSEDYSGDWAHWEGVGEKPNDIASSTHYPLLGPYDSNDPAIVAKHMKTMAEAGIDGIVYSWWGIGGYEEEPLPLVLREAERAGLKVALYLEREDAPTPEGRIADTTRDLVHIAREFGKHPAYLRVDGAPVVFLYSRVMGQLSGAEWAVAVKAAEKAVGPLVLMPDGVNPINVASFDGAHDYNPLGMVTAAGDGLMDTASAVFRANVGMEESAGKISTVTIIPGYDDTKIRKPGAVADRRNGWTYETLWRAAIGADPHWVLITSFNEWHEGSELEPSLEYGDKYMRMTRDFAAVFKASKPKGDGSAATGDALAATPDEVAALKALYQGKRVGLLQDLSPISPAFLWLMGSGLDVVPVAPTDVVKGLDPKAMPVVVFAGGESYTATHKKQGDVVQGLVAYLKAGGAVVAAPSLPWPFYYDETGKPNTVTSNLGIPVKGGWETPPPGRTLTFTPNAATAPSLTALAFPAGGDLRWRPSGKTDGKDTYLPLLTLVDEKGKNQGDGAAFVKHASTAPVGGKAAYIWFRLLDQPIAGRLLFEAFRLIGTENAK